VPIIKSTVALLAGATTLAGQAGLADANCICDNKCAGFSCGSGGGGFRHAGCYDYEGQGKCLLASSVQEEFFDSMIEVTLYY
jgi:hypothetical protein